MNIQDALEILRPKAKWKMSGYGFDGLMWLDEEQSKPTEAQVNACIAAHEYKEKRRAEYPSVGDQLGALWAGGQEMAEMRAKVEAVKAKYPKP